MFLFLSLGVIGGLILSTTENGKDVAIFLREKAEIIKDKAIEKFNEIKKTNSGY